MENFSVFQNVWVPLIAAIVGGALSLVGAIIAILLADRKNRSARSDERDQKGAERAYDTFWKLMDAYNTAANLKSQIDEMFDEVAQNDANDLEPCAKVRQIVGATRASEKIEPSDTSFLIEQKQADLINDLHLIYQRIQNIISSAAMYNELRGELTRLLEEHSSNIQLEEGTRLAVELEGADIQRIDLRVSQLNSLLGQIMEMLEKDLPKCWCVISQFKDAAQNRFGKKFPEFEIKSLQVGLNSFSKAASNTK